VATEDLYTSLGVKKGATTEEIRSAYKTLARKHHPDANAGDTKAEERFKEISHAHDVLSDPDKRRAYDASRSPFARMPNGGAGGAAGAAGGFGGDFADLFGQFFRGGKPPGEERAASRRGRDLEVEVTLSFDQAMRGVQVPVSVDKQETCGSCGGSGAKPGTSPRLCPECRGRGVRGRDAGGFSLGEPCPKCGGNGTVIDDPCETCNGVGSTSARRRYQVKVPAGVKDGTKVRLKGKGQAGTRGAPAGDLIVITRVTASGIFARQGDDLVIEVPITFPEAALGAQVEIPTPDGRVKLTVPPGSPDGRSLRVAGKGAPKLKGSGRGDLIARLKIQIPDTLSAPEREALERYQRLDTRNPRQRLFL
jgi:molecular chaperone DnaJ